MLALLYVTTTTAISAYRSASTKRPVSPIRTGPTRSTPQPHHAMMMPDVSGERHGAFSSSHNDCTHGYTGEINVGPTFVGPCDAILT